MGEAVANRPTIRDVAAKAGVGVATVDRVLNGRAAVRAETAEKVYEAAKSIGYHAAGLIGQRLHENVPKVRLGFVLNKEKQAFYQALSDEIEQAVAAFPGISGRAIIRYAHSQTPEDIRRLMLEMQGEVDAIAAASVDHHLLTTAVQDLQDQGVPVFALLNDFGQGFRHAYVGLNNLKVGRIAAWTMAMATPRKGKIGVFVGGHRWHGHALRETGFRSYFREHAPTSVILDTMVNLETRQLTYEATLELIARHPDLSGLYIAGGGMEGAIAALREMRAPGDVALVLNELTPDSRAALSDRYATMVISTPLPSICRDLVGLMVQAVQEGVGTTTSQHFLEPQLFTPESV